MAAQGQEMAPQRTTVMTIGALSRRTGVPVKILREYEDLGLIYTVGRSPGNYRLFDDEALWCVQTIGGLRGLGLTLKEIQALASTYLNDRGEPIGPRLARLLGAAPTRTEDRIAELGSCSSGSTATRRSTRPSWRAWRTSAPRIPAGVNRRVDSPPGGRP